MTVKEVSAVRKRLLVLSADLSAFMLTFYDAVLDDSRIDCAHCKECGQHFTSPPIADLIRHSLRHYPA